MDGVDANQMFGQNRYKKRGDGVTPFNSGLKCKVVAKMTESLSTKIKGNKSGNGILCVHQTPGSGMNEFSKKISAMCDRQNDL